MRLGGYFVDTLGADRCMAVFISIIAAGQVVFSYGLQIKSWPVMVCTNNIIACNLICHSNLIIFVEIVVHWTSDIWNW